MLRWCLSTVRALGGHDSRPRWSCYFSPRTSRPPKFQLSRAYTDATPIVDLVKGPGISFVASSSAEPHCTRRQGALGLSSSSSTDCLETHRRSIRFRASHFDIDTLTGYLSSKDVASDHPLIYSPTTIRSLYYRAESWNQLERLDSKMLTRLMDIFGSLSIDPCISVIYRVPLASRLLKASTRRTHWAFVMKVGKHKLARGMSLHDSDRFWLMCADLAMAQAQAPLKPLSGDTYGAILRARTQYHIIRRHSRRPEVHAHYFEALLDLQDPRLLDIAACDLSFLLRTHRAFHPRLQRQLYRLVIQHGNSLSIRSQEAILTALWTRACQETSGTFDVVHKDGLAKEGLSGCKDATAIAHCLSVTLFGIVDPPPHDKPVNSFSHLFSAFSPTHALALRWSSLVSLSIFNSSEILRFNEHHWATDCTAPQVTSCWQVIFGLATLERVLQEMSSTLPVQSITELILGSTHRFCQLWLTCAKPYIVSQDLACAIAASLLRIASVLPDAKLFKDCQDIYCLGDSLEAPRSLMQKFFATQYIVAAVRTLGPLPDVVLAALRVFSSDLKQQHQVLASAVEALAPIDIFLAQTLYALMQEIETEVDSGTTHSLAMSLARQGSLHQAITLLNDSQISVEQRGVLVSEISRGLRENPRSCHPHGVFVTLVNELAALYQLHLPPEHFRGHLEQLFIALAQRGRGTQLFPVILSILERLPSFFQPRFFVRYCRVLIRHRQFATVSKLVNTLTVADLRVAQSLHILTNRTTRGFRVFEQIAHSRGPTSLRLSSRPRHSSHAEPPLERSLQERLKSGQLPAAKNIFTRAVAMVPSARCTALGNILLHGLSRQPTARNGRGVRKVLTLLENLVQNRGFRPDRVTANILIKAMISWRSAFNSARLRQLFDQLVRGGYPAAEYSSLHLPFNTRQAQFSGSPGLSKLPSLVSFEKHLRPLFKMFIKAFYVCNDVEAARKVVGILKVEEHKNTMAKEARRRARTRGRIKAIQKNVVRPDTME